MTISIDEEFFNRGTLLCEARRASHGTWFSRPRRTIHFGVTEIIFPHAYNVVFRPSPFLAFGFQMDIAGLHAPFQMAMFVRENND